ncbi:leucine-rich repeat and immunoglobulin-like domain-containing nogo receptor-interacting protein 1 [Phlebotomus argentipes]|uniref:leucine-rich repeat and immunoglobulin-like domain-containing nogo receptor-interacting protein 1 n=1 Tax=Phlebotomus argentipes TaxID=94469 RepID=UPI0028935F5C|nr:leucine-rich repeat and immunoglobulin-like domain-containing nogo receptor-interacting protein 1 [Phlebotomus argentipes]XP_059613902.1 leucine-rich repeat and immunoglobulin-like domain-containing nogo receptor-interacting protein 1 [Phlebotomus argentipes]
MKDVWAAGPLLRCLIVVLSALPLALSLTPRATDLEVPKRCNLERVFKRIGYNCAKLDLKEIPQYLKTSMEILDASYNRIRDLSPQSFNRYTDLQYLYLAENMIQTIEPGTFALLKNLEAVDLAYNALTTIPAELFSLPLLRNLYIYSNNLYELKADLEALEKPITAPLQLINIADCRLNAVPDFGILPDLWHLNISSNPLQQIQPQQFSPLCNLKTVDLNNTKMSPCACQQTTFYMRKRSIAIKNGMFNCDSSAEELIYCPDVVNSTREAADYDECNAVREVKVLNEQATSSWMIVALSILGCLVAFILLLCICHRRNKKSAKMSQKISLSDVKPSEENGNRDNLLSYEKT